MFDQCVRIASFRSPLTSTLRANALLPFSVTLCFSKVLFAALTLFLLSHPHIVTTSIRMVPVLCATKEDLGGCTAIQIFKLLLACGKWTGSAHLPTQANQHVTTYSGVLLHHYVRNRRSLPLQIQFFRRHLCIQALLPRILVPHFTHELAPQHIPQLC
jgi:hypothetical protein